ncbi:hypothetical protein WA158_005288 [Blastocystis sp. Blastoise]
MISLRHSIQSRYISSFIRSAQTSSTNLKTHKSKSSSQWLRRQSQDPFVKKSQQDGYRSRAAYKLLEIDQKYKIIKPNSFIVDCGCAPGSWCQVMLKKKQVQDDISIIGIDLLPIKPLQGMHFIQGDFTSSSVQQNLSSLLNNRKVNLITSDIAPSFSGNHKTDHIRQIGLSESVFDFSLNYLDTNGILLMKVFQGTELQSFINTLKNHFQSVIQIKPKASRDESSELYILCKILK